MSHLLEEIQTAAAHLRPRLICPIQMLGFFFFGFFQKKPEHSYKKSNHFTPLSECGYSWVSGESDETPPQRRPL